MLGHLAQTGTLCFGPVRDGEQVLVLIDEWIAHPRRPGREEALGDLVWRYFRSHGPATVKDVTRWTKLVAGDVRVGLALAQPRLSRLDVEGVEYFMDPCTPDLLDACRDRARGVFLLPGEEAALGDKFADTLDGGVRAATTLAFVGGCGGAGATTLAAEAYGRLTGRPREPILPVVRLQEKP